MYFGETQSSQMQMLTRKKTKSREKLEGPRMTLWQQKLRFSKIIITET